jgi:hypothetical protein
MDFLLRYGLRICHFFRSARRRFVISNACALPVLMTNNNNVIFLKTANSGQK